LITPSSYFVLAIFIGIIICIIHPITIRYSKADKAKNFIIDYSWAPLLGVVLLICITFVPGQIIITGLVGTSTIKPYSILILFFSLAFLCVALDLTGFFAYLALKSAKNSGGSGVRLFNSFYLLSSVLTMFTSNDIVILTLTPIICYFTHYTKTNHIPYLIGQFFAANIWSMALYVGNPTNIIVAQAYNLTFIGYSQWMLLPTISAGILSYILLRIIFRKELAKDLTPPDVNPRNALLDLPGAIIGIILLIGCLSCLSIAPIVGWEMWVITMIFASIMALQMFLNDLIRYIDPKVPMIRDIFQTRKMHPFTRSLLKNVIRPPLSKENHGLLKEDHLNYQHYIILSIRKTLKRMPWKIAPFVIGMFIMVDILATYGWIELGSQSLSAIFEQNSHLANTIIMGIVSALACNIFNNQPMTILFTRILQGINFNSNPITGQAIMFALIIGSNLGANFTLIGALAGIMWNAITKEKGAEITAKTFSKYGILVSPIVLLFTCFILGIQFLF
jgi:Na+/H+ antiporter NhaD/arsenite permease-like protein